MQLFLHFSKVTYYIIVARGTAFALLNYKCNESKRPTSVQVTKLALLRVAHRITGPSQMKYAFYSSFLTAALISAYLHLFVLLDSCN